MKPQNSILCQQFDHLKNNAPKISAVFMAWLKKEHIHMHFFKGSPEKKLQVLQNFFATLRVTFERGENHIGKFIQINFGDLKPVHSSAITTIFTTSEDPEVHLVLACANAFETLEPQYW